jgi:diguanylate cyclase (GGDEF)-like protein
MTTKELKPAFDAALIERELKSHHMPLGFSPPLEHHMESETGAERARQLVIRGSFGLILFAVYLLVDYQLTPDTFAIALVLKLGVVLPLASALMIVLWFNPRPVVRELGIGAVIFVAVQSTFAVMLLSESPLRDGQATSIVLAILFLTVVMRVRFPYAVVTCLAIYATYIFAVTSLPENPPERYRADIVIFGLAVALALFGSWYGQLQMRRNYLLNFAARLRNESLDGIARRDPMTGLDNRRSLDMKLQEMRGSAPEDEDFAVVLFDLDHFKPYNDSLGHLAGDTCLKRVAELVQEGMREGTDLAFRFGGEEFLVLLRETDLVDALGVAERLRRTIEHAAIPHPTSGVCTASFGVASAKIGSPITNEELVQSADSALYAAKRNGRNQVWPPFLKTGGAEIIDMAERKSGK